MLKLIRRFLHIGESVNKAKPEKQSCQYGGLVEFYGIQDWWGDHLNASDRECVRTVFPDFDAGYVCEMTANLPGFLLGIAGKVKKYSIGTALKVVDKAEMELGGSDAREVFFFYSEMIRFCYPLRHEDNRWLDKTIECCKKQIDVSDQAIPLINKSHKEMGIIEKTKAPKDLSHRGYTQLSIILEKQGRIRDAITIANEALSAGWGGDWEKRIGRLESKLNKQGRKENT